MVFGSGVFSRSSCWWLLNFIDRWKWKVELWVVEPGVQVEVHAEGEVLEFLFAVGGWGEGEDLIQIIIGLLNLGIRISMTVHYIFGSDAHWRHLVEEWTVGLVEIEGGRGEFWMINHTRLIHLGTWKITWQYYRLPRLKLARSRTHLLRHLQLAQSIHHLVIIFHFCLRLEPFIKILKLIVFVRKFAIVW